MADPPSTPAHQITAQAEPLPPLTLNAADRVDLHLHTLASDGAWTPAALIDHLAANDFRVAAIADHDTQRSVAEATRRGARRGIRIIPAVEVTTRWSGRQWHVLVYGIAPNRADPAAQPFRSLMADLEAQALTLAEDARQRIEAQGKPLPSLEEIAGGRPLLPYHVLTSAIREGHVRNLKEAAELVSGLGGGFSPDEPLERVVDAAHQAGGLTVVAHPGRSDSVGALLPADLDRMLAEIPIDGLEAHYRSHTDEQTALYRNLAAEKGLLIGVGSDSHAPHQPVNPRPWRAIWASELLGRLGVSVTPPEEGPAWAPGMELAPPAASAAAGTA
ncbi:MAG: PHP domain-containing protein [Thermomicrobiales bacterium]|nr:PHP domain-containing protein [Thermomicrobiales bacterium]